MDGMKVCLHSRVAMRVLLEVAAFQARDADRSTRRRARSTGPTSSGAA